MPTIDLESASASGRHAVGTWRENGAATMTNEVESIGGASGNNKTNVSSGAKVPSANGIPSTTAKAVAAIKSPEHTELQPEQFDPIIKYLLSQRLKAPWYIPPGKDGAFPTGQDGWWTTLFITKGRAFDMVFQPWLAVTLNAIIWTSCSQLIPGFEPYGAETANNWRSAFQLGLSATLGFLLVFRLNRSILRFWEAMKSWGAIVFYSRSLISAILVHGRDRPFHRDQVIVWTATIPIAAKKTLRRIDTTIEDDLSTILTREEIDAVNTSWNPSLYCANEARFHLKQLFDVTKESGPLSPARSGEMRQHEKLLDFIIQQVGQSENILNTPLPLVYVTHLRTFLMVYLLALPYLTESLWDWWTIPIVSMTAFMFLGIEGASAEVECPFEKGKVNDLDLDHYCEDVMRDIQMLVSRHHERAREAVKKTF